MTRRKMAPFFTWLLLLLALPTPPAAVASGEDVCARVKIEIRQELTLERQGFDAHMRITNGLADMGLDDVGVAVTFADEQGNPVAATADPSDTGARFFIRVDRLENIDDVDGGGTVPAASAADIHWLIIPAPGAAGGLSSGKMYSVGAVLTYSVNGEAHTTEVAPDFIFVKPMPALTLDYFLPDEVFGDDAFTAAIEPSEPFTLGVRVRNSGAGVARGLRIDSAQPRIVDNQQGLLVDFVIDGSRVNGQAAGGSLQVGFGDISPGSAATARWIMHCSLSGRFIEFSADFSHADELGGELTSLIGAANTHFLVRDVLVDLPGRDAVEDFLARDGDIYRVYESQNTEAEVPDRSASAALTLLGRDGGRTRYALTVEPAPGLLYVRLPDPFKGANRIGGVLRSDGKRIRAQNAWLSKSRDGHAWQHFINLFDAGGTGRYTITFEDAEALPRAPVLQFIEDQSVPEAGQLSFEVQASDPDGTAPALSAAPLPAGALFSDQGGGRGIFAWTPLAGQAGTYIVRFCAADGTFSDSQSVAIRVRATGDSDGDGLDDDWERKYFGSLDRDGSGDFDGDGFSDLEEYRRGSDPAAANHAPAAPLVLGPRDGRHVAALSPELTILNSRDADGDSLHYAFEIFSDETLQTAVASQDGVPPGNATTAWRVPQPLADNHRYVWRVRASDGFARSLWAYGTFFVDTANDAPAVPQAAFPAPDGSVCSEAPELQVVGILDADDDRLSCTFEVYADQALAEPAAVSPPLVPAEDGHLRWQVQPALAEAAWYYWRVTVSDGRGGVAHSRAAAFYVDLTESAPPPPMPSAPPEGAVVAASPLELSAAGVARPEGGPVRYRFELDTAASFDSGALRCSGEIPAGDGAAAWQVDGLSEDTRYYWRVQAVDGPCGSPWERSCFFVSARNEAPRAPAVRNPGEGAWVPGLQPLLEVAPAVDAEQEPLSYMFEVYADEGLRDLSEQGRSPAPRWRVPAALADKTRYFWRARAVDAQGTAGPWSPAASFFVNAADSDASRRIRVRLLDDSGAPLSRVRMRAYTADGQYTGRRARTGTNGVARFKTARFPDGGYRFRADYRGERFWSDPLQLPYRHTLDMVIRHQPVTLTVREGPDPVSGARVRLFSADGVRLRPRRRTGDDGRCVFRLPAGAFRFKVRRHGRRYWSEPFTVREGEEVWVDMELGALRRARRAGKGRKKP